MLGFGKWSGRRIALVRWGKEPGANQGVRRLRSEQLEARDLLSVSVPGLTHSPELASGAWAGGGAQVGQYPWVSTAKMSAPSEVAQAVDYVMATGVDVADTTLETTPGDAPATVVDPEAVSVSHREAAKTALQIARTRDERREAVREAMSHGMPLDEIEAYLDWLDHLRGGRAS